MTQNYIVFILSDVLSIMNRNESYRTRKKKNDFYDILLRKRDRLIVFINIVDYYVLNGNEKKKDLESSVEKNHNILCIF